MTINQVVVTALLVGFVVGLVIGLVILSIERRIPKKTRILNVKDGIMLEYRYSKHPRS